MRAGVWHTRRIGARSHARLDALVVGRRGGRPSEAPLLSARMTIEIVRARASRELLVRLATQRFGDLVKAVVDLRRRIMAIGGELHSDEEAVLLEDGSRQEDLRGINIYPDESVESWIEFDSMINLRPSQGNRSRSVDDAAVQDQSRAVVGDLVHGGRE